MHFGFAGSRVVGVNRAWCVVVRKAVIQHGIFGFAVKTADRTDAWQLYVTHQLAVVIILLHFGDRIDHVSREERTGAFADFQHVRRFRDHVFPFCLRRLGHINRDQTLIRCFEVGREVQDVAFAVDQVVIGAALAVQRDKNAVWFG